MFIKIFCGDSQKYLLLQSDNVTLNKKKEMINSDLYPILCAYIDVMAEPVETKQTEKLNFLCDVWKKMHDIRKEHDSSEDCGYPCIEEVICRIVPNTPYELMIPVLSDSQEAEKINLISENPLLDTPVSACNEEVSIIQVDEKTYITTGPIFVMNDEGKTIDRIWHIIKDVLN